MTVRPHSLVFAAAVLLAACTEAKAPPERKSETSRDTAPNIVGKWRAKKTQWEPEPPKSVTHAQLMTIHADGTFSKTVYGKTSGGTYVFEGDILKATPEPGHGAPIAYTVEKLTQTELVVAWTDDLDRLRIFFERDS